MKTSLAVGLCLALSICVCRSFADEVQWRSAPPGSSASSAGTSNANIVPASATGPAVIINQPVGFSGPADGDFFHPARGVFRAKNDDDAKPVSPENSGTPVPQAFTPFVIDSVPQPPTAVEPQLGQKDKVVPVPAPEKIPVAPTPIPQGIVVYSDGSVAGGGPVTSAIMGGAGCGCGISTGMPVFTESVGCDGCGSCLSDSCCRNSCCFDDCCCWNSNRNNLWVSGEYLLWAFSRPNTPPLVTSGTAGQPTTTGTPGSMTGPALGQAGTTVLYGGNTFNDPVHSGARFTFGFWLPNCCNWGLEFSGLFLASATSTFSAGPSATEIIGRPFLDVTPGSKITATGQSPFQSTELVNLPGTVNGNVRVDYWSRAWGVEGNALYKLCCGPNWRLNFLFGYRNFQLDENISINESLVTAPPSSLGIHVGDSFTTHNSFNGGQVGFEGEVKFCQRMFFGGFVKVAVGDVYQNINIAGNLQSGGTPFGSGIFANYSTNMGSFSRNQFGVLPEIALKLGVDVTPNLRVFVGYNFLFLSSVVRPGDTIDPTINNNNILTTTPGVGPARPAVIFTNSSFWAQGVTAGLEYHY